LNYGDGFSVERFLLVPFLLNISLFETLNEICSRIPNEVLRVCLAESFEKLVNGQAGELGNRTSMIVETRSVWRVSIKGGIKKNEACMFPISSACPSTERSSAGF
jgi:hypothetical protein